MYQGDNCLLDELNYFSMKKHLLFLLTILSLTTYVSCCYDLFDRIPKRRPTPPTPSTEK